MKTLITTLLAALILPVMAEEGEKQPTSLIGGGQFEARTFVAIETTDFDVIDRDAVGVGVSYYVLDNIGLEVESLLYDTSNHFIDRLNANLLWRTPITEDFAFIPFAGVTRDIDAHDWGFHVGGRGEARLWRDLWLSAGLRWQKVNSDDSATVDGGLTWKF